VTRPTWGRGSRRVEFSSPSEHLYSPICMRLVPRVRHDASQPFAVTPDAPPPFVSCRGHLPALLRPQQRACWSESPADSAGSFFLARPGRKFGSSNTHYDRRFAVVVPITSLRISTGALAPRPERTSGRSIQPRISTLICLRVISLRRTSGEGHASFDDGQIANRATGPGTTPRGSFSPEPCASPCACLQYWLWPFSIT